MKILKIILLALLVLLGTTLWSQVAINLDESTAHESAMLDVTSTERGVLIPRMNTIQMNDIDDPAPGLSLFNTDSNNYSFYNGAQWITLGNGFDTDWHINGNHLYSGQIGNVGIGIINPAAKLDVRGSGPDEGVIFQTGNSDLSHKLAFFGGKQSDPNPFISWKHGDPLRFTTDEGGWSEKMRISSEGNLGVGTDGVADKGGLLTKTKDGSGSKAISHRVTIANATDDNVLRLAGPETYGHGARLNFGDGDYAYISEDLDDNLKIHASGRVAFTGGFVGIGTVTPTANLDVPGSTKFGSTGTPFFEVKQLTGNTHYSMNALFIAFPSGFNQSNTRVICLEIRYQFEGSYYYIGPGHPGNQVYYSISSEGITITYPAGMTNQPYRMVLMKF